MRGSPARCGKARKNPWDAATFVRDAAAPRLSSEDKQAKVFVTIAKRMEQRNDASKIADALAAAGGSLSPERRTIFWMCEKMAASEPATARQLAHYAAAVSRERKQAPQTWQVVLGHIASVQDQQADVRLVDGSTMRVLNRRLPLPPGEWSVLRWQSGGPTSVEAYG